MTAKTLTGFKLIGHEVQILTPTYSSQNISELYHV